MMRHTVDCSMITMEEYCEVLNHQLKRMSSSDNLESLVENSLFTSLMRRCTKCHTSDEVRLRLVIKAVLMPQENQN